jgi:outer membrane protein assembly factor BamB
VAYADGTIYLGTLDAKMIAIEAETGKKKWDVWSVAQKDNPGGIYGYNSAAVAVGDMVVIGTAGGETPTRHHLTAFEQKTGKLFAPVNQVRNAWGMLGPHFRAGTVGQQ